MDRITVWAHIHAERHAIATTLSNLSAAQWDAPSLCPGWTVKAVAAHVISAPQVGWPQLLSMAGRNLGRSYNTMILREVQRLAEDATPESVLADYATYATSTRRVPITTSLEPLIDALVHHQDIVRPLGLEHEMAPEAAAAAADRARTLAFLSGARQVVTGTRMVATDIDWVRGDGPTLSGPMSELLMVCMGRARVARDLTGDGRAVLARS